MPEGHEIRLEDYRILLREELDRRCERNPSYSMRAFARDLGIRSSTLTYILSGKRGMSRKLAERVANGLGLPVKEKEFFCNLVESQAARNSAKRQAALSRVIRQIESSASKIDIFRCSETLMIRSGRIMDTRQRLVDFCNGFISDLREGPSDGKIHRFQVHLVQYKLPESDGD